MEEKPIIQLTWKKAFLLIAICVGVVSDRAGHAYRLKGHLDSGDLWAAAMTIVIAICAVAFVGWWAGREE
jgi:hypothetical protein